MDRQPSESCSTVLRVAARAAHGARVIDGISARCIAAVLSRAADVWEGTVVTITPFALWKVATASDRSVVVVKRQRLLNRHGRAGLSLRVLRYDAHQRHPNEPRDHLQRMTRGTNRPSVASKQDEWAHGGARGAWIAQVTKNVKANLFSVHFLSAASSHASKTPPNAALHAYGPNCGASAVP
jgi:hypothetical protein